ncbi:MAG TPA: KH domain-containing protein [Patescibacteria group bacterium]|nr:KH domain-containing protein [Patescibacteria group bacterium]
MAERFTDQEFVEYVVRAIVGHPDDVRTERTIDERGVLITLHINPEDMGYVIGRQGQTARSIRTLLKIVGAKNNARVNLKIYEPEGSRRAHRERQEAAGMQQQPQPSREEERVDTSAIDLTI